MHRITLMALREETRGRSPFVGAADLAMVPLRSKPFDVTDVDSRARLCPLARAPRAAGRGCLATKYALCERVCATAWEIGMPDTETPIATAQKCRIPHSPPALQEPRFRQRQDRRPLFPSCPLPAAHARRHPGTDGPVPARRGPQRVLRKHGRWPIAGALTGWPP